MATPITIKTDKVLDAKGLACPMPIVKTKKAIEEIEPGQVIEVHATDKGSKADIQGWAKNTGHQYLGTIEDGDVLKHYLRKANPNEVKEETKFPHTATNEELQKRLEANENLTVLDVREPAEYAFSRIQGAKSIPLGELEGRLGELNPEDDIHVVCRTGNRSDLAAQLLTEKGFKKVKNVIPGMSQWTGPIEKQE
jgi:TusA-related sulfurtransferase/rhodanese-related sulfurtransferase